MILSDPPPRLMKTKTKINKWNLIKLRLHSDGAAVRIYPMPKGKGEAPPSLGFSWQEHWNGLPFPSPMPESEKWKWSSSVVSDPQRFPQTAAYQAPPSKGFFRQGYWSGLPLPSPQQNGRRGEFEFRFKPHFCHRCSEGSNKPCVDQDPGTPQRLKQNCVWASPLEVDPPQSCQYLHKTGK